MKTCEVCKKPSKFHVGWCGSSVCAPQLTPIRLSEKELTHAAVS
jgi:hypothetical protein